MHDAQEDIAGLLVLLLDVLAHEVGEGDVARLVALDDFARGLVHNYYMIILVNDLHILCE